MEPGEGSELSPALCRRVAGSPEPGTATLRFRCCLPVATRWGKLSRLSKTISTASGCRSIAWNSRERQRNLFFIWRRRRCCPIHGRSRIFVLCLLVILSALVLWRLIPRSGKSSQLWIYLLVLVDAFAGTQMILKSSSNAGYPFPLIFQFVVVFHYWSWYVFSFDKLRANRAKAVAGHRASRTLRSHARLFATGAVFRGSSDRAEFDLSRGSVVVLQTQWTGGSAVRV